MLLTSTATALVRLFCATNRATKTLCPIRRDFTYQAPLYPTRPGISRDVSMEANAARHCLCAAAVGEVPWLQISGRQRRIISSPSPVKCSASHRLRCCTPTRIQASHTYSGIYSKCRVLLYSAWVAHFASLGHEVETTRRPRLAQVEMHLERRF